MKTKLYSLIGYTSHSIYFGNLLIKLLLARTLLMKLVTNMQSKFAFWVLSNQSVLITEMIEL